jgi:hypothetical protein
MIDLRVRPIDEKSVRISGMTPVLAAMLGELPEILDLREAPAAQVRLYPNPIAGDDNANKDWQQTTGAELRHLFVSAGETVTRDLTAIAADGEDASSGYQVTFPVEHVNAWMSAINQARLILAEVHQIDEAEMSRADLDPRRPKDMAALRIHVLGYLLHLFVELESGDELANSL